MILFFFSNNALTPEIMNNGTAGKNITAKYNLPFSLAVPITSLKNGATVTKIELNAEKVTAIISFRLLKGLRWNSILELLAAKIKATKLPHPS